MFGTQFTNKHYEKNFFLITSLRGHSLNPAIRAIFKSRPVRYDSSAVRLSYRIIGSTHNLPQLVSMTLQTEPTSTVNHK